MLFFDGGRVDNWRYISICLNLSLWRSSLISLSFENSGLSKELASSCHELQWKYWQLLSSSYVASLTANPMQAKAAERWAVEMAFHGEFTSTLKSWKWLQELLQLESRQCSSGSKGMGKWWCYTERFGWWWGVYWPKKGRKWLSLSEMC